MSLLFRSAHSEDVPAVARLAAHSFPWVGASQRDWEDGLVDSPLGGHEKLHCRRIPFKSDAAFGKKAGLVPTTGRSVHADDPEYWEAVAEAFRAFAVDFPERTTLLARR